MATTWPLVQGGLVRRSQTANLCPEAPTLSLFKGSFMQTDKSARSRKTGIAIVGALLGGTLVGVPLVAQNAIAGDLEPGARETLASAVPGVDVQFKGREATVSGRGKSEAELQQAVAAVEKIRGVRWAKFKTASDSALPSVTMPSATVSAPTATASIKPGTFGLNFSPATGGIKALGSIDTKVNADALSAQVSRVFGAKLLGDLKVDPSIKMPKWFGSLPGVMAKFPTIKTGSMNIDTDGIALTGSLPDLAALSQLEAAVKGVDFKTDLSGVSIDPQVHITTDAKGTTLTGVVGSEAERDALVKQATRVFGSPVVDNMTVVANAKGTDWSADLVWALPSFPAIKGGKLDLTSDGLSLGGTVAKDADLSALTKALKGFGVKVSNAVKVAPAATTTPSASGLSDAQMAQINGTVVNYAWGSYSLDKTAIGKLDAIIPLLKQTDQTVVITGYLSMPHNGDQGADSLRRAEAVAAYLRAKGIDPKRISVSGRGTANAVASNDTAQGRLANQRATLTLKGN